ncbi:hypothetical protein ACFXHA_04575 [Nocardia sp. NPDC059240]|uniref:hypothetical protein n=1 Tax=Nocardia sp. NPDC059240 TaxID=3346786 RepID=UPI0036BB1529
MTTQAPEQATPQHVSIWGWIARGLVLVVFVPPRLLWEAIKAIPRLIAAAFRLFTEHLAKPLAILFRDWVFRPLRNFVRNYLWHLLIQQLLFGVILTPLGAFLLAYLLRPIQRAIEEWLWRRVLKPGIPWMFRHLVLPVATAIVRVFVLAWTWLIVWPIATTWRQVIRPGGRWFLVHVVEPIDTWVRRWILGPATRAARAIGRTLRTTVVFLGTWLIMWPLRQLWRWILRPLLLALAAIVVFGWKVATTVVAVTVVAPCRWLNRTVLQPLFAAIARAWRALAAPVRWAYRNVVMPWRSRAAEVWTLVFGR